ncbi:MAG TPA: FtsX-like permease family protein, partial [Longimicrobiaceae bacterium]|nr:FtsX-like permease family protein [Longimicrobiaceae bacterium]
MEPERTPANLYYPLAPGQVPAASLAVRLRGPATLDFAPRLRELAAAVDPTLRLGTVRSMADGNRQQQIVARLVALVVGLVLLSVFLLSAAGIYALMSFTVTRRRREIGIRSALGAHPRRLLASIFSRAAGQLAIGAVVGLGVAALLDRFSGGEFTGGAGAVVLPAVVAIMLAVGLVAALGPARRALRIQPMEALREE